MTRLLIGSAALSLLASAAIAGTPTSLSDIQMDKVTAAGTVIIPAGIISINIPAVSVDLGIVTVPNPNPPPPSVDVPITISSPGYSYSSPPFVIRTPTITVHVGT